MNHILIWGNELVEKIVDILLKALEQITAKIEFHLAAHQKQQDNIDSLLIIHEEKLREIDMLISAIPCDFDLCEIKIKEFNESQELVNEQIALGDEMYITILKQQLSMVFFYEQAARLTFNVNKAVNNYNEAIIELQRANIAKYRAGPKKKSLASQQKWSLAREYFVEEIPKHSTLKKARKAAAQRAGIVVEERQLVKMLPKPR
ncbi:hypothetical protein [Methylovulum psychrotolerans]|uniref:Uncharacterized protein n=1 Tax=Methylovulum psychrotolerans TaxID=1704499 RepID=A0A2S5CQW4_9GAMM|nr:hypothetical protein [Methylovulum psychrotolerans]POZ53195.1 hypothetical protein AADEFJLK_00211 [Methylovulum psychrotolerans]